MECRRGAEDLSFSEAIGAESERSRIALPLQDRIGSYVDRGYYCSQLRRLWRFFGRDAVLVLRQEELLQNHQQCLNKICRHLGLSSMPAVPSEKHHTGEYHAPMDPDSRAHLKKLFRHEIEQLQVLLGWDCSDWLKK
jgi:hypothetical protein